MTSTAISSSILALSHYSSSDQMQIYQKDGQQFLQLTVWALERLNLLALQLAPVLPQLTAIPFGMLIVGCIILPMISPENNCLQHIARIQPILNYGDEIIHVACLVSYVSLIALGFPLQGGIALAGLGLTLLLKYGWVPPKINSFLHPLSSGAHMASGFLANSYLLRVVMILAGGLALAPFLLKIFQKFYLEKKHPQLEHPFHGLHDKKDEISQNLPKEGETIDKWLDHISFSINPTYVYSDHMEELLPLDYPESDYEKLFIDLNEKIEKSHIELSLEQIGGMKNIEDLVVRGIFTEASLLNVEALRKTTASIASSLLQEEVDFKSKIEAFADFGGSCGLGWEKEIAWLFKPKTEDPDWAVHHELGLGRGACIEKVMTALMKETKKGLLGGGSNNSHSTSGAQMLMYSEYRSYQAESHRQKFCPLTSNVFFRYLAPDYSVDPTGIKNTPRKDRNGVYNIIFEAAYHGGIMLDISPGFTLVDFYELKLRLKKENLLSNPDHVVDYIYDAIKLEKQTDSKGKEVLSRRISFQTVNRWLQKFDEKHPALHVIDDPNTTGLLFDKVFDDSTLSKTGVKLMLWDMGILEKIDSSEE